MFLISFYFHVLLVQNLILKTIKPLKKSLKIPFLLLIILNHKILLVVPLSGLPLILVFPTLSMKNLSMFKRRPKNLSRDQKYSSPKLKDKNFLEIFHMFPSMKFPSIIKRVFKGRNMLFRGG